MGTTLFGSSTSRRREDAAHAEDHSAKHDRRQMELIAQEKARREAERQRAEQRLSDAREQEAQLHTEIEKAIKDLSLSENRLVNAKANLAKASADLKRLGNQELELVEINSPAEIITELK
jgi:septal ring factor EnvC (AmiA/AmiB activator)